MLKKAIREATLTVKFFPVICGTAFMNKGIVLLINAVLIIFPSTEAFNIMSNDESGEPIIKSSDNEPFAALAFKVMTDPYVGKLTFFRVYSGSVSSGTYIYNSTKNKRERLGRILQMHANNRAEIKEVFAGEIAAAVGLKDTATGDTMCDEKRPVILESMIFPEPVISVAIEPKTKVTKIRWGSITKLSKKTCFKTKTNSEMVNYYLRMEHLDIIVDVYAEAQSRS